MRSSGMSGGADRRRIAVVVKGYPRLSETFIAQELLGLERRGLALTIVSLRHPTDPAVHEINRAIQAPVRYLPEYLHQEPGRVLRAWRSAAALADLPGGAAPVAARPAARSEHQPRAALRSGAGARARAAGGRRPAVRPLSAHARLGRPLRRPPARPALVRLGARQGHLDHAGVGEGREAARLRLGDRVHRCGRR